MPVSKLPGAIQARAFKLACKQHGLPIPVAEYRFWPGRKFAFDWCWPDYLLACECEGGIWVRGRHNRGQGYLNDMLKYSEAAVRGWCVVRVVPSDLFSESTFDLLRRGMRRPR